MGARALERERGPGITTTQLAGQVALVTGGNQGIGQATVLELAARGAAVVFTVPDRDVSPDATLEALDRIGAQHEAFVADAADSHQVANAVAAVLARFGQIDLLVNNAGIYPRAFAVDLDEAIWDRTLAVNLKGAWLASRAVLPSMIERRSGRIINVTSVAAVRGAVRGAHYAASKAGLIALTKSIALEVAEYGILVNAVAPGLSDTAQPRYGMSEAEIELAAAALPLGRMAEAADIARAIAFLAGPDSSYLTGQTVHINGGSWLG